MHGQAKHKSDGYNLQRKKKYLKNKYSNFTKLWEIFQARRINVGEIR